MATVHVGRRWERALGNYSFHCGTLTYLEKVRAIPEPNTNKQISDEELSPEGQYDHP